MRHRKIGMIVAVTVAYTMRRLARPEQAVADAAIRR
jgi:hypothetical protein